MYRKIILAVSVVFLAIIPFFWLKPGEMDLGGDSSRLYFYDPINYLKSFPLYAITPNGIGSESTGYYLIPFIYLLFIIKKVVLSPYLLITVFNSLSLVVAFLSIYGIVVTFLKNGTENIKDNSGVYFAAILAGLFYILSPVLTFIGWDNALFNHSQIFLNPLVFFLLLKYLLSSNIIYALMALLVTFLFAPNFSPSPYLFSFFLFAITCLLLYAIKIKKIHLNMKRIVVLGLLFIVIHLFHLYPLVMNLFLQGSALHESAFSSWGKFDRGLSYFSMIAQDTKLSNNLFSLLQGDTKGIPLDFLWIVFPILIVVGVIFRKKARETDSNFLLVFVFFLTTTFFATAKITFFGLEIYKLLFNIPGFSMFRNYYGQFSHVFIFFYAIVVGYTLFYIFSSLTNRYKKIYIMTLLVALIIVSAIPFISGKRNSAGANKGTSNEIPFKIKMDPSYEDFLQYVRSNKIDGKYLSFPIDDFGYQILGGKEGGVYRGPPTIAYLAQKNEYTGMTGLGQFADLFVNAVRERDYNTIRSILSLLNIRYIFYNSDPYIYPEYSENYTGYPFAQVKSYMPADQELYQKFIDNLPVTKRVNFGNHYHLYEIDMKDYVPHIYTAKQQLLYDQSTQDILTELSFYRDDLRIALFSKDTFQKENENIKSFFVNPKKKSDLSDKNAQVITSPVSRDFYTLIHPLLILGDKRKYEDPALKRDTEFQDGIYKAEKLITDLTFDFQKSTSYAQETWKNMLSQYSHAMIEVINQMGGSKDTFYSGVNSQMKVWNLLVQHEYMISALTKQSKFLSDEKKNSLTKFSDTVFDDLYNRLRLDVEGKRNIFYSLNILSSGDYEVYIGKAKVKKNSLQEVSLTADNTVINVAGVQDEGEWIRLKDLKLQNNNNAIFQLTLPYYPNVIDGAVLGELESNIPNQSYKIENDVILNYAKWLVTQYTQWEPNIPYLISFDYVISSNISSQWISYKIIIEFDSVGKSAILRFMQDDKILKNTIEDFNTAADIKIKNVSVIGLDYPKIVLKKKDPTEDRKINTPQIVFTKINPTKYKVKVIGAKDPYTLVFLDGFSKNWKIFLKKSDEPKDEIFTASYFNDDIKEGAHRNIFLERSTFETWGYKPIADEKHTMVNGYANAWYITPKDTADLMDYTLVLELTTQRTFYPLFFISLFGVSICILWFGNLMLKSQKFLRLRKRVKNNESE